MTTLERLEAMLPRIESLVTEARAIAAEEQCNELCGCPSCLRLRGISAGLVLAEQEARSTMAEQLRDTFSDLVDCRPCPKCGESRHLEVLSLGPMQPGGEPVLVECGCGWRFGFAVKGTAPDAPAPAPPGV